MSTLKELDPTISLAEQMHSEDGPVVLINVFNVDAVDAEALVSAWARDAAFMKAQPGYISTQLHRGVAGSTTFVNYAVWQDVKSFRNAFTDPEFQRRIKEYPKSAIVSPHLFKKIAVADLCVA